MASVESKTKAPRSQSIVVRITQDEYERLQPEISASGSRSLRELARAKVLRAVGEPSLAGVAQKVSALERAIARLEHALNPAHDFDSSPAGVPLKAASLKPKSENLKPRPENIQPRKDRQPSHGRD
jgi:hypothetical protein